MIEGFRSPEKTKSVLGIDIGSSAVRLLELSKVADGYRLEACLTEILPVLDTGRPPDHEALCQTITLGQIVGYEFAFGHGKRPRFFGQNQSGGTAHWPV